MAELQHFSHECPLTLPKILDGICSVCLKDDHVEFTCKFCSFDICKACTQLPQKVSHDFHPEHALEFCLRQYNRKPAHIVCSGCGIMSSGSFYQCEECEIYLDLACATQENIFRAWDFKELLHDSHIHLLKRCRPGPDALGSCLLCELPLFPYALCYGCVHCYLFFHERCLDIPREIQHPVHPAHSLKRLDYTRTTCFCDACGDQINSVPFGCVECRFNIHLRCADSLLRGLIHKSHHHRLFYRTRAHQNLTKEIQCQICMKSGVIFLDSYYQCVECNLIFHFECLEIPDLVFKKSCHIHPLTCQIYLAKDVEHCGVCETTVHKGHHVYSCQECDFLGHIECILQEEVPSPLYLKDLYSCGSLVTRATNQETTNNSENKLVVIGIQHNHVMRPALMSELIDDDARLCGTIVSCMACGDVYHPECANDNEVNGHPLHSDHRLSLALTSGSKCLACNREIIMHGFYCGTCQVSFHAKCVKAVKLPAKPHSHYVYNFWVENSRLTRACSICKRPCGASFYGCIDCDFKSHVECLGFPANVKNQRHPHTVVEVIYDYWRSCSLCGSKIQKDDHTNYSCNHCGDYFHKTCFMSMNDLEAVTEEEQIIDIYLMNIERDLFGLLEAGKS
ncbi:unnamed protein product [Microthlaspi erraticum]|uniref:Phorbol-ester/DAG-type domain-containing protein n=1 Tax=Microthlaspi erraticum TaxID=1685480 RepID=A0A6D2KAL0_9BRAS|nr:unnamed protein product [Microthlaspi erraticum]